MVPWKLVGLINDGERRPRHGEVWVDGIPPSQGALVRVISDGSTILIIRWIRFSEGA